MDELINKINRLKNPTVVGLDTSINFIPEFIKKQALEKFGNTMQAAANAILNFNKKIVDEIYEIVPAVKLQSAYYELYGFYGIWALTETLNYCKNKGMFTIVDGKKNDIDSSMKAYSDAYLGKSELLNGEQICAFNCDAITINPYLGTDSIKPIAQNCELFNKAAFMLIKTSNPSSCELQNAKLENQQFLFEQTAQICLKFNDFQNSKHGFNKIGAVVGATHPNELKLLRQKLPHTFFLVPGFGAQKATISEIKFAFDHNKTGAIINNSRAILGAYLHQNCSELEFAIKAKEAAIEMKTQLQNLLHSSSI